jgi:hypothetical protein
LSSVGVKFFMKGSALRSRNTPASAARESSDAESVVTYLGTVVGAAMRMSTLPAVSRDDFAAV